MKVRLFPLSIFHNIREHKQAEETLLESEEKLRYFIDFVPDCFTFFDSEIKQRSPLKMYNIFALFQGTAGYREGTKIEV